jgi:hypothetical protein
MRRLASGTRELGVPLDHLAWTLSGFPEALLRGVSTFALRPSQASIQRYAFVHTTVHRSVRPVTRRTCATTLTVVSSHPGWPPANAIPAPAKRSRLPLILGIVGTFLLLCCGGTAIAAVVSSGKPKPARPAATATAGLVSAGGRTSGPSARPSPSSSSVEPVPAVTTTQPVAPIPTGTTHKPVPRPTTKKPAPGPTTPSYRHGVHPGAFCAPRGAFGYTTTGLLMQCKPSATDTRNRWRAA